jgi:hypothetical protein
MDMTMAVVSDDVRFAPAPTDVPAGGQIDIVGVVDQFWCERVPCRVPIVCVSVGFSADAAEFGREVTVGVQLLDPEGSSIREQQQLYTVNTPPPSVSRSTFYPVFRFQHVVLPAFGPYVFRVWLEESHQIDLPVQASQLGG